jgi:hypothetical protein
MRIASRQFVFSLLVTGSQPTKIREFLAWNNILPPSKHEQNEDILIVGSEIIKMARESMAKAREEMPPNCAVSGDGSWEHPRHSQRCMTTIFCQETSKVIDYRIKSSRREDGERNFCPIPQNMETVSMREMVEELKEDPRIKFFVHDKDARTSKLLRESGWNVIDIIDTNHAMKSFDLKLKNYGFEKWVKIKLRRWMIHCVKLTGTAEEKIALWKNILQHLIGNHEKCPYRHKKGNTHEYGDLKKMVRSATSFANFSIMSHGYFRDATVTTRPKSTNHLIARSSSFVQKM